MNHINNLLYQYRNFTVIFIYTQNIKSYICEGSDGLTDSVRFLECNEYVDHLRDLVQLLVTSF